MKICELCLLPARIFCDSDQAMLCWGCDAKVHGANFLVARHSRSLLCHACQAPTPWTAAGAKLGRTFSVCASCVVGDASRGEGEETEGGSHNEFDSDNDEIDDDNGDLGGGDVDFDEDGDNQVVPVPPPPPQPSSSSSSCSEEAENAVNNGDSVTATAAVAISLKRIRESASDFRPPDDLDRSCRRRSCGSALVARTRRSEPDGGAALPVDSSGHRKDRRIDLNGPGSPSDPAIESEMRYPRLDTRNLSGECEAVDL